MKQKTQKILIQIHRGFLSKEQSDSVSDDEVLAYVPENKGSYKSFDRIGDDPYEEARITPFSYKWVAKQLKRDPNLTAYDMLIGAGFKTQAEEVAAE